MIDKLEKEYAKFNQTDFAVAVTNGTGALHLALVSLGVGKGDEVIVPEYTMISSAWAVTYTGATPVFVDCGEDLLIDTAKIEEKITTRTKAIMPVHIFGRVCEMDKIIELAKKYDLRIIEDCAEAHGAEYKGKKVGSFDTGCFSFYRSKIINAEEGGIITTNNKQDYKKMQDMKALCFGETYDYYHKQIGFNYRIPETQAKLALESLRNFEENNKNRHKIAGWYNKYLPAYLQMPKRNVVWVYDLKHEKKNLIVSELRKQGIGARHGFKPMSMQSMYYNENYKALKAFYASKKVFYLPVNPTMSEKEIKNICLKLHN